MRTCQLSSAPQCARVVDKHVDPAEPRDGRVDARLGRHLVSQIDHAGQRLHAESLHLGRHRVDGPWERRLWLGRLGGDDDVTAAPGQRQRTLTADAP